MFKNFFSLKLFIENYDTIAEITSLTELNYLERNRIKSVILPFITYNKKEYTIGDIFINKSTKEFIIFSFYTHNESVNKLGFFTFKNYKTFELFNDINLDDASCSNYSKKRFQFNTMNEIENINKFEKIGNAILLNKKSLYMKFSILFPTVNLSTFEMCKKIFTKINQVQMIVHNGENTFDFNVDNSIIKKEIIDNNKNLNIHIQLSIVNVENSLELINHEILSLNSKEIDHHCLIYFNTNTFSVSIVSDNNISFEYLCENIGDYTSLFPFDKKTRTKYQKALLKLIATIY